MQFFYHEEAGKKELFLAKEEQKHIKVRRKKLKSLNIRNLKDDYLYTYEIDLKSFALYLKAKQRLVEEKESFSLAMAVIEPKELEKCLVFLNELNLSKLVLVYTAYSQANFKLDLKRIKRILINSCKQSGRGKLMDIQIYENLSSFLQKYPKAIALDFSGEKASFDKNELYFIGPEGGFSQEELALFHKKQGLKTQNILRSKTAAIALASLLALS